MLELVLLLLEESRSRTRMTKVLTLMMAQSPWRGLRLSSWLRGLPAFLVHQGPLDLLRQRVMLQVCGLLWGFWKRSRKQR